MAIYIKNEIKTDKGILSIDGDLSMQISKLPDNHRGWIFRNDYSVNVSATDKPFEYNIEDNKIYFYTQNSSKMEEQEIEHAALIEGKDKVETEEIIAGKYCEYIDQWEYVLIHNGKNLTAKILELIK